MEFCLNFSVGFTTPPLMLVIRNLVLVHKVKSKEAVCTAGGRGRHAEQSPPELSTFSMYQGRVFDNFDISAKWCCRCRIFGEPLLELSPYLDSILKTGYPGPPPKQCKSMSKLSYSTGDTALVIFGSNNLKCLVPTGPSFKGQEAFQSI